MNVFVYLDLMENIVQRVGFNFFFVLIIQICFLYVGICYVVNCSFFYLFIKIVFFEIVFFFFVLQMLMNVKQILIFVLMEVFVLIYMEFMNVYVLKDGVDFSVIMVSLL